MLKDKVQLTEIYHISCNRSISVSTQGKMSLKQHVTESCFVLPQESYPVISSQLVNYIYKKLLIIYVCLNKYVLMTRLMKTKLCANELCPIVFICVIIILK